MRAALGAVVLAAVGGVGWLAMPRANPAPPPGVLPGQVELRQVDLAFDAAGSVRGMALREGDAVHAGKQVAELDDAGLIGAQALAVAQRDAAQAKLDLLLAGTRPEEIERARANVANVQATATRAEATFSRQEDLFNRKVVSQQAYDDALMTRDNARASLAQYQAMLAELQAGPRPIEIDAARADLRAAEANVRQAALLLTHVKLNASVDGVVTARLVDPGTVVRAGAPVYSVAVAGEAWVRAFASEAMLGRIPPRAKVSVASEGGHAWRGEIDTVFPMVEFAPGTAEPVYRLRIRIDNPDAALRQGMAVTVTLPPGPGV
jgi:HlyD family secretion protein